jgi:hypothetical protein
MQEVIASIQNNSAIERDSSPCPSSSPKVAAAHSFSASESTGKSSVGLQSRFFALRFDGAGKNRPKIRAISCVSEENRSHASVVGNLRRSTKMKPVCRQPT